MSFSPLWVSGALGPACCSISGAAGGQPLPSDNPAPLRCPAVPINAHGMGAEAAGRVGTEAAAGLQSLVLTFAEPQFPCLCREGGDRGSLWEPALQTSFSGLLCANKPLSGGPPCPSLVRAAFT